MKIPKSAFVLGAIALGLGTWSAVSDDHDANSGLLFGRVWVDRTPQKDTDTTDVFIVVESEPIGIFQRASRWEGAFSLFRYEPRGDGKLQLLFPQDGSKHEVKYSAKSCTESGFDYCLELTGAPRGTKKYFSKKEWVIESEGKDAAALQREVARCIQE